MGFVDKVGRIKRVKSLSTFEQKSNIKHFSPHRNGQETTGDKILPCSPRQNVDYTMNLVASCWTPSIFINFFFWKPDQTGTPASNLLCTIETESSSLLAFFFRAFVWMYTYDILSSFPSGISTERTLSFHYNSDNTLLFSYLRVSKFCGCLFGNCFANQAASAKLLVVGAPIKSGRSLEGCWNTVFYHAGPQDVTKQRFCKIFWRSV